LDHLDQLEIVDVSRLAAWTMPGPLPGPAARLPIGSPRPNC